MMSDTRRSLQLCRRSFTHSDIMRFRSIISIFVNSARMGRAELIYIEE